MHTVKAHVQIHSCINVCVCVLQEYVFTFSFWICTNNKHTICQVLAEFSAVCTELTLSFAAALAVSTALSALHTWTQLHVCGSEQVSENAHLAPLETDPCGICLLPLGRPHGWHTEVGDILTPGSPWHLPSANTRCTTVMPPTPPDGPAGKWWRFTLSGKHVLFYLNSCD